MRPAAHVLVALLLLALALAGCATRGSIRLPATSLALSVPLDTASAIAEARQLCTQGNGRQVWSVANTGSMLPLFAENAVLLSEPAPFAELQIGDIVLFRAPGRPLPIVHRIVEKRAGGYWTKGDNMGRMDSVLVSESNYLGRVCAILYATRAPR